MNNTIFRTVAQLLVGAGVSGGILALLMHTCLHGQSGALFPKLSTLLGSVSALCIFAYVGASLVRTVLQTLRYRLILQSGDAPAPGFFHIFLVTMSRNMFVDMLPSRLGELSYVVMLRQGHQVPVASGLSSLAVAFLFDLAALAVLIALVILHQLFRSGMQWQLLVTAVLVMLAFVVGMILLFPGLSKGISWGRRWAALLPWRPARRLAEKCLDFLDEFSRSLAQARRAGIAGRLMLYSLGVRAAKYLGLFCLFYGIVKPNFPDVNRDLATALMALLSAEAGASLPLPTFMGFGSYETGGMLAMLALGATKEAALLIMLGLHILSQIVDYLLGGAALLGFLALVARNRRRARTGDARATRRIPWLQIVVGLILCALAAKFLLNEYRNLRLQRAMAPPTEFGEAAAPGQGNEQMLAAMLRGRTGFVVWSSNRSGNHDIWIRELPNGEARQLTTHPHTEYYPRISPDGKKVLFARANKEWVPQRDYFNWNAVIVDLESGEEQEAAVDANSPVWSADGRKIYFQRQGRQLVEKELASGTETVVLESGKNVPIFPDTWLCLPNVSPKGDKFAITLAGALRTNAIIDRKGNVQFIGDGCEPTWSPDGSYLVKVDHRTWQNNAFYRLDAKKPEPELWFDMPGEFHHEYFPKIANTGDLLVFGSSRGDHEHDKADYEIFLWKIGWPPESAARLTFHSGNDNWPDIFVYP